MGDVDKMFEPNTIGWLTLLPQRMRTSTKEDPEFVERFEQMVQVRNDLKKIANSIKSWSSAMKKLYSAAKTLGKAVQTDEAVQSDASWNGDILMKDDSALQNINEKIAMINALIAQKSRLKYMKLKGEHAEHKLEQLRKKEANENFEKRSQKYLTIKQESEKQREEIMEQILLVVNKYVQQANEKGVSDLVKPQLQAFKLSQFHMFLNCQKLVQGREMDEGLKELETHWTNFTSRIANEIPNNAAGGSFDGSAMFLREKLGPAAQKVMEEYGDDSADELEDDDDEEAPPKMAELKKGKRKEQEKPPPKTQNAGGFRDSDFDGEDLSDLDSDDEGAKEQTENDSDDSEA